MLFTLSFRFGIFVYCFFCIHGFETIGFAAYYKRKLFTDSYANVAGRRMPFSSAKGGATYKLYCSVSELSITLEQQGILIAFPLQICCWAKLWWYQDHVTTLNVLQSCLSLIIKNSKCHENVGSHAHSL